MELSRLKAQGEAADPEEAAVLLGELLEKDRVSEGALKERLGGLEVRLETVQKKLGQGLEREKAKADVSRLKKELAEKEPKLVPLRLEQEAAGKEAGLDGSALGRESGAADPFGCGGTTGGSGKPAPGAECEKRGAFGAFPEPAGHGAAGSRLQGGGEKISGCGGGKRPAAKGAFKAGTGLL